MVSLQKMLIIRRIFKFAFIAFVSLLIVGAISGRTYQVLSEASDLEKYPAPGLLIDVDGSLMHIHCQGIGSPTVLIEQGAGGFSSAWENIHSEISNSTRVCAYDRAGMGYSEPIGRALTNSEVVKRLHDLLVAADENDDLVLVGWSAGGIYAREFQRQFPDRVKGLVFVDSSHEQQIPRLSNGPNSGSQDNTNTLMEIAKYFAPFGIFRISGLIEGQVAALSIPDSLREKVLAQYHFSHAISAQLNETKGIRADLRKNKPLTTLGDLPLAVLTRGAPIKLPDSAPDYITLDYLQGQRDAWNDLQRELAALSSNSEHIIAASSGHSIHFDDPLLLVNTVTRTVDRAREYR